MCRTLNSDIATESTNIQNLISKNHDIVTSEFNEQNNQLTSILSILNTGLCVVKSVQRGTITKTNNDTTIWYNSENVIINKINIEKSLVFVSMVNGVNQTSGLPVPTCTARIISSTSIKIDYSGSPRHGWDMHIDWQVIEFY